MNRIGIFLMTFLWCNSFKSLCNDLMSLKIFNLLNAWNSHQNSLSKTNSLAEWASQRITSDKPRRYHFVPKQVIDFEVSETYIHRTIQYLIHRSTQLKSIMKLKCKDNLQKCSNSHFDSNHDSPLRIRPHPDNLNSIDCPICCYSKDSQSRDSLSIMVLLKLGNIHYFHLRKGK